MPHLADTFFPFFLIYELRTREVHPAAGREVVLRCSEDFCPCAGLPECPAFPSWTKSLSRQGANVCCHLALCLWNPAERILSGPKASRGSSSQACVLIPGWETMPESGSLSFLTWGHLLCLLHGASVFFCTAHSRPTPPFSQVTSLGKPILA